MTDAEIMRTKQKAAEEKKAEEEEKKELEPGEEAKEHHVDVVKPVHWNETGEKIRQKPKKK
jgi:hypothetical protein